MNPNYGPIALVHRQGCETIYPSLLALTTAVGIDWFISNVTTDFGVEKEKDWSLRGPQGEIICLSHREIWLLEHRCYDSYEFHSFFYKKTKDSRLSLERWNRPVPRTGFSTRKYGKYFRHMKTYRSVRLSAQVDPDEPQARAAQRGRNIPNAWDDYYRKDFRNKNWKRFRKHQYK